MKDKLLALLKTKFTGVSEALLIRMAEKLAKTVTQEDQTDAAVEAVTIQQIIEAESDRRVTEAVKTAQKTAIQNYETTHGLKDGLKTVTGDAVPEPTKPNTGAKVELTLEAITAAITAATRPLADEIVALKTGKVSETRKQKLETVISKLPETLRKPYVRIPLTDMSEDDFETFITETTTEVENMSAELSSKGAVFTPPAGGGKPQGNAPTKEEVEKLVSQL
jgi:hypothetical protein